MSEAGRPGEEPAMLPREQVMERLWDFVDGELEQAEAAAIQHHLAMCERCFLQYDWHRAYTRFMRRAGERMVLTGLWRRVFAALLEESRRGGN